MSTETTKALSKVPAVTLIFWIVKIAATTLGETAGDALSMSMNLGYLVSTLIFTAIFAVILSIQIKAKSFKAPLYWTTIVATTTMGTTLADFLDRSLGIGYLGGSTILISLVLISLAVWYKNLGSISVSDISTPKAEWFYWITIMFSQTLGTALGDWAADTARLGYVKAAFIFSFVLVIVLILHYSTKISKTILFWIAFVMTRPLGAVVGDFLDKPIAKGGLELSRYTASAVLLIFMVLCLVIFKQKAAEKAH